MSTPTTRELLEGAARAIGLHGLSWNEKSQCLTDYDGIWWDSLTDDGDCARLEAALCLEVEWNTEHVNVGRSCFHKGDWQLAGEQYTNHANDKQAARRYASTRAAYEISKGMR